MFSPKELEGEVDHSFFDSDGEDSHSKDLEKNERSSDAGKAVWKDGADSQPAQPESCRTEGSRTERAYSPSRVTLQEEKGTSHSSEVEDRSRTSSISSLKSEPEVKDDTIAEDVASIRSKSAEYREDDDEDGYHQSEDESEDESENESEDESADESEDEEVSLSWKLPLGPKDGVKLGTPKKTVRKHCHRSPSPSSSELDTETDSGDGSPPECCTSEPHLQTRPRSSIPSSSSSSSSSSSPLWRPRLGSDGPIERPPEENSDDTVTDVTPLSTPDVSPIQSLDLNLGRAGEKEREMESRGVREQQDRQESVPPSPFSEGPGQDLDEALLSVESQLGSDLVIDCPGGRNRKNYSFTNEEVRRIDRENQRLLRKLSRPAPKARPGSSGRVTSPTVPAIHLYHSTLNRQREQQRIERENLAFLRRLESVKPTAGMRRAEQLADYQRQASYLGTPAPLPTIYRCSSRMDRLSSRTSSGKSTRPGSSIHRHGSRAAFDTSTTTATSPVPRSTRAGPPRAAWS